MKKIIQKINKNAFLRNVILALCIFILFIFSLSFLLTIFTRHNEYIKVPTFEGLSYTKAKILAEASSLKLEINDSVYVKGVAGGTILAQHPKSDREVKAGRHIFLTTNSFNKKMIKVPYVTGYSLRQAKNNLQIVGLGVAELIYRDDIATNNILEQQYNGKVISKKSNLMVELGAEITLIVGKSQSDSLCLIPNIIGLTLHEAKSRLWEVGLNIGATKFDSDVNSEYINNAKVFTQTPIGGITTELGGVISFELTLDKDKVKKGAQRAINELERVRKQREEKLEEGNDLNL